MLEYLNIFPHLSAAGNQERSTSRATDSILIGKTLRHHRAQVHASSRCSISISFAALSWIVARKRLCLRSWRTRCDATCAAPARGAPGSVRNWLNWSGGSKDAINPAFLRLKRYAKLSGSSHATCVRRFRRSGHECGHKGHGTNRCSAFADLPCGVPQAIEGRCSRLHKLCQRDSRCALHHDTAKPGSQEFPAAAHHQ